MTRNVSKLREKLMLKFRSRWSLNCRRSLQNAIYNYLKVKGFFLTSVLAWFQLLEQAGLIWLNLISWDSYNQVTEYRTDTEIRKFNKYCFEKSKIRECVVFLSKIKFWWCSQYLPISFWFNWFFFVLYLLNLLFR